MDPSLLHLRHLTFGIDSITGASEEQLSLALQLKCFLVTEGVPESDSLSEVADATLGVGAQARRDRLWGTVTRACGLEPDFTISEGALADLDLIGGIMKGTMLADVAESLEAAREASLKAHAALLDQLQRPPHGHGQRQPVGPGPGPHNGAAGPPGPGPGVPGQAEHTAAGTGAGAGVAGTMAGRQSFRGPQQQQQQPHQQQQQPPHATWPGGGAGHGSGAGSQDGPGGFNSRGSDANGNGRWMGSGGNPHAPGCGPGPQPGFSHPSAGAGPGTGPWHRPGPGPGGMHADGMAGGGPGSRWASVKRPAAVEAGGPVGNEEDDGRGGGENGDMGGPPPGPALGFQTARHKMIAEAARKGQPPPVFNNQQAPRTGLMRPQKKQQTGAPAGGRGGGASSVKGFVPPFVARAVDGPPGQGGRGGAAGGGAGGAGGDGPEVESPYPPRLLEMLSERNLLQYGNDGSVVVPEPLAKLDPKIIDAVFNEVLDRSAAITWADIAGQDAAKRLVQEVVVWPMLNPQLFTGARAPPRGLLLFGPPGTGKTLIGKAVAANISATFFSISASSLTSKWIGEGEKMVRALFALAGCLQPSVIFIDEIDSLLSMRKAEGEHEASRRLKTEMLVQMDGCDPGSGERRVLVVGATNRPEELDEAARRRMPKQLYIPLPCGEARLQMLHNAFKPGSGVSHALCEADLRKVVERTAGYSGSDMKNLIQEACQGPVRDLFRSLGAAGVTNVAASDLRPVCLRDFQLASKAQKRTVSDCEVERYEKYDVQFGAKYIDPGVGGPGMGGPGGPGGPGGAGEELEEEW